MAREPKPFSMKATLVKMVIASIFLNALIAAAWFTSDPQESPASTWITSVQRIRYEVLAPVEETATLEAMHADARELSREECIACHGDKQDSDLSLHRIHLTSELIPGLVCSDCHREISLEPASEGFQPRLVDVSFCKQCHSPFPGLEPDSPMEPEDFDIDCTTCHTGKAAYKHQEHYLSHVIAPKECKGCHGGRVLPWPAKHEQPDWMDVHGIEALDAEEGVEECFQCHEGRLRFCEDCHDDKPPSHEPRERWLVAHVDRAQADTRTCFFCHEADFCKECHVNHEADWLEKHPDYVRANDSDECWECHSESFCAYCHVTLE
jgi:hypothetical protein